MSTVPCRDCGFLLHADARGCPKCARNVEAETMIDKAIRFRLAPCLILVVILTLALCFYFVRWN